MPKRNASMFKLDPAPKVITFDCYGTLVQWYEVLQREIGVILAAHGQDGAAAPAILDAFSAQGRRLTAEAPHRLYKDILRVGFALAFREHGLTPSADEIERIASSPTTMGPHPDVPDALRRLRAHYKLAIFTNSDDDLIAPTVARIGVPFDYVITAEQAQAYKPSRRFFEYACARRDGNVLGHEGASRTRPARHLGEPARRDRQPRLASLRRSVGPNRRRRHAVAG
jgi:2-haloalkanoic acid dehalogenase type II